MNARDGNHAARDSLFDDFRAIIAFAQDLLHSTGRTGESIDAVGAKLGETLEEAKLRAESAQALVVENTREAVEAADQYVRAHPWKSVSIAAGVGLILGFIISRRS